MPEDERNAESVLLYYHYVQLTETALKDTKLQQLEWCKELELMGRIRVTPEGLNGTLDGTDDNLKEYTIRMDDKYGHHQDGASLIDWKWAKYPDRCSRRFISVSVKIKDEVVGMVLDEDERKKMLETRGGIHLSPEDWHGMLQTKDDDIVLLDVRNFYETRVGYFVQGETPNDAQAKKAVDPFTRSFSDFKYFVDKSAEEYKDKKVLMYCTGGVRCERASQYLISKGVDDVYQLYGGIHAYQEKYPRGFFKGKNFVYDPRVAVGAGDVEEQRMKIEKSSETERLHEKVCTLQKHCDVLGDCLSPFSWFGLDLWTSSSTSLSSTSAPLESSDISLRPGELQEDIGVMQNDVEVVGRCMVCAKPHDEYHTPYDKGARSQTRCSYCRVLCLVCDACKLDENNKEDIARLQCEMCLLQNRSVADPIPESGDKEEEEGKEGRAGQALGTD